MQLMPVLAGPPSPEPARGLRSHSTTLATTLLLLALLAPLAAAQGDKDGNFPIISISPTTVTLPKPSGRFYLGNGDFLPHAFKRRYKSLVKVQYHGPGEGTIKLMATGDCGEKDSPMEVRFEPESISFSSLTNATTTARFVQFVKLADKGNAKASSSAFYTCVVKVVRNKKIARGITETVFFMKPSSPSGARRK